LPVSLEFEPRVFVNIPVSKYNNNNNNNNNNNKADIYIVS